jgi:murein DD-endopeptidase MepM/ murein hydrolase activator NlpD
MRSSRHPSSPGAQRSSDPQTLIEAGSAQPSQLREVAVLSDPFYGVRREMGVAVLVTALALHMQAVQHRQAALQRAVWPAHGTVTSPYGRDGSRWHPGIDIGTLRSLRVSAAVQGRVVLAGRPRGYEGYGNVIVVRSRRGLTELYGHLSSIGVHRGQRVAAGQRIATAGCTGWCTGTHLHFEVRRRDRTLSPFLTVLRPLLHRQKPLALPKPVVRPSRSLASAIRKPNA